MINPHPPSDLQYHRLHAIVANCVYKLIACGRGIPNDCSVHRFGFLARNATNKPVAQKSLELSEASVGRLLAPMEVLVNTIGIHDVSR